MAGRETGNPAHATGKPDSCVRVVRKYACQIHTVEETVKLQEQGSRAQANGLNDLGKFAPRHRH